MVDSLTIEIEHLTIRSSVHIFNMSCIATCFSSHYGEELWRWSRGHFDGSFVSPRLNDTSSMKLDSSNTFSQFYQLLKTL